MSREDTQRVIQKKNRTSMIITLIILLLLVSVIIYYFRYRINPTNTPKERIEIDQNEGTENIPPEAPLIPLEKGIFSDYYGQAKKRMESMSMKEKVSQLFFVRHPEQGGEELAINDCPGGYILFGVDFKNATKTKLVNKLKEYQSTANIPLLIGTDEEGGTVIRASKYKAYRSNPFLSPQEIDKVGGIAGIIQDTKDKSKFLLELGINVNLAPVADVSTNSQDFIFGRTFGKNAKQTAEYVSEVVETMKQQGILSALKHFPGYGNNIDTHTNIAYDKRSMDTFKTSDFLPFIAGIHAGVPCILVSHNIVECMDPIYPSSISPNVHTILRDNLNFTGIIMTDDLAMDGIKNYTNGTDAAVLAVKAGNDMLISSDYILQRDAVLAAVNSNDIDVNLIEQAVKRILAMKYAMGLLK